MVCIGIIQRDGSWDSFLKTIQPDYPWNRVTRLISEGSHNIMHRTLMLNSSEATLKLLGFSKTTSSVFADAGGLTTEDIEFLIDLLWGSRKSVLPLCFKGLLPGFPVLLFLLYNMTDYTDLLDVVPLWLEVQDLVQRCYLADSSTYERNILRQVSRWIHDKVSGPFRTVALDYVPVDDDDARAVVKAYSDLLSRQSLYLSHLLCFWTRRALDKLAPIAAKAALERLWLEIDREKDGRWLITEEGSLERTHLTAHYFDTPDTQIREDMLRMLLGIEIYSLLGRVLALVTHESENALDIWDHFVDSLQDFAAVLKQLMKVPAARPEPLKSEWVKVSRLLSLRLDSGIPCPTPKYILKEATESWNLLLTKQLAKASVTYVCSSPRCADPSFTLSSPEAKFACGGCGIAHYCSQRCQRIPTLLSVERLDNRCRVLDQSPFVRKTCVNSAMQKKGALRNKRLRVDADL
ncbi:hypothetical protein RHS01_08802 [Rhizoctonia solani]|uniref:MYND-type domain-containing protein n=1 Tax=Rhizoctonia solani TaxID=456999 RepID=A0A8H7M260_9AGAM|nr:hypothetical protein RHS01_08802 [Rhizoctonia solani]